jgi:hypothetical protein
MEVGGQRNAPVALPPLKKAGTHCTRGYVDTRTCLDGCPETLLAFYTIPGLFSGGKVTKVWR